MTTLVCNWIEDGTVSRFETLKRRDARLRQSIARESLGNLVYIAYPDAYFLWLPLAEETRADRVVKALMDNTISVPTAEPFLVSTSVPQAIRIALGSVSINILRSALVKVREVIEFEQYGLRGSYGVCVY